MIATCLFARVTATFALRWSARNPIAFRSFDRTVDTTTASASLPCHESTDATSTKSPPGAKPKSDASRNRRCDLTEKGQSESRAGRFMHSAQTVLYSGVHLLQWYDLRDCTPYRASKSVSGFGKRATRTCNNLTCAAYGDCTAICVGLSPLLNKPATCIVTRYASPSFTSDERLLGGLVFVPRVPSPSSPKLSESDSSSSRSVTSPHPPSKTPPATRVSINSNALEVARVATTPGRSFRSPVATET